MIKLTKEWQFIKKGAIFNEPVEAMVEAKTSSGKPFLYNGIPAGIPINYDSELRLK